MKGDIKFEGILRIEGHLDGNIIAPIDVMPISLILNKNLIWFVSICTSQSRVVISPSGCFIGDLTGLRGAYIDPSAVGG